jgi:hypothetical protein
MWLQASRNRGVIPGEAATDPASAGSCAARGMAWWVSTGQQARAYDSHSRCNGSSALLPIALIAYGLVDILIFWGWYAERRDQGAGTSNPSGSAPHWWAPIRVHLVAGKLMWACKWGTTSGGHASSLDGGFGLNVGPDVREERVDVACMLLNAYREHARPQNRFTSILASAPAAAPQPRPDSRLKGVRSTDPVDRVGYVRIHSHRAQQRTPSRQRQSQRAGKL